MLAVRPAHRRRHERPPILPNPLGSPRFRRVGCECGNLGPGPTDLDLGSNVDRHVGMMTVRRAFVATRVAAGRGRGLSTLPSAPMRRPRLFTQLGLATIAALALVGTSTAAAGPNPKTLVLRLRDLPSGFGVQTTTNYTIEVVAAVWGVTVAQLRAWGYVAAYEADFARVVQVPKTAPGVFGVRSFASTFASPGGARSQWARNADGCRHHKALRLAAKIGDATRFCSAIITVASRLVQAYIVSWTHENAFETLVAYGNEGRVAPAQALTLAKLQDARMR